MICTIEQCGAHAPLYGALRRPNDRGTPHAPLRVPPASKGILSRGTLTAVHAPYRVDSNAPHYSSIAALDLGLAC